ncbi:MAG TPA: IPT/TIG domain-containing protein [Chitinophagaceae bacterium]|nr:IPT/TIG domain-containing protein [Chitinophagaceae bacterium]
MKKNIFRSVNISFATGIIMISLFISCKKYNSLGFTPGSGLPTITSVHTWDKVDTTVHYDTLVSYDASGNLVQTLRARTNLAYPFDSATTAGNLGDYYIIYGSNLGSATNITFNGYLAYFNRALVTDNSIVVQVPSKTPYLGSQANDSLVITTLHGKVGYKFSILPPPPSPDSYSNYNFSAGSQITLTGVGFASVTSVSVSGANGETGTTSIVSQNDSVLVLQFDATTATRGILVFNYDAAGTSETVKGTQELVDVDNAYQVFTDNYAPNWGSWSWGPAGPSNAEAKSGTASFNAQYGANSWWIDGFRYGGGGPTDGLAYSADYKYLSFWVYGGTADEKIYIELGNTGFNQNQTSANQYDVPPGVWTYYKIPVNNIIWNNTGTTNWAANSSQPLNTVAFFMNSNSVAEQLYFDDVILIK